MTSLKRAAKEGCLSLSRSPSSRENKEAVSDPSSGWLLGSEVFKQVLSRRASFCPSNSLQTLSLALRERALKESTAVALTWVRGTRVG